jgi:hypothetical protein
VSGDVRDVPRTTRRLLGVEHTSVRTTYTVYNCNRTALEPTRRTRLGSTGIGFMREALRKPRRP